MTAEFQTLVIHNLPERKNSYTLFGRNEFRQTIRAWLDESDPKSSIIVIHGKPGVGKTELAIQIGYDYVLKDDYYLNAAASDQAIQFDRLIFIPPKESDVGRNSSKEASDEASSIMGYIYEKIAESLNRQDVLRWSFVEQIKRIHEALSVQRTLLIIDGLDVMNSSSEDRSRRSIYTFLKNLPKSCKAIITTHNVHTLFLSLCRSKELTELNQQHSLALAKSIFEKITDAEALTLYREVGGNPLAIELRASLLKNGIRDDNQETGASVTAQEVVAETIKRLNDPVAHKFLLAFSLFDGRAGFSALSAVAETDSALSHAAVDKLSKYSLVKLIPDEPCVQPGDFRLDVYHPEVKKYVRQLFDGNYLLNEKMRDQWINYYVTLRGDKEAGWTIFSNYQPDGKNFKPEMANIFKVIDHCLYITPEKWREASQIVDNYRETFFSLGFWDKRIGYCDEIVNRAKKAEDKLMQSKFQRLLAWMYCFKGEYKKARNVSSEALTVANSAMIEQRDDELAKDRCRQTQYKVHNTLGQIALRERKFSAARSSFFDALQIVSLHHKTEAFAINFHLCEVEYELAKESQRKLVLAHKKGGVKQTNKKWLNELKPRWYQLRTDLLAILHEAQNADRQHERAEAHVLYYLGKVSRRGRQPDDMDFHEARERFLESLEIANKFDDQVLRARIWLAQGQLEESAGFRNEAIPLIERAYQELWQFKMKREYEDTEIFMQNRLEISRERIEKLQLGQLSPEENTYEREMNRLSQKKEQSTVVMLQKDIIGQFNKNDLNQLCFEFGRILWEDIEGKGITDTVRNLIETCIKQRILNELLDLLKQIRPNGNWLLYQLVKPE